MLGESQNVLSGKNSEKVQFIIIQFIAHFVVLNLGVLLDFDLCTCIGQQISNCGNHGVLQV